MLRKIQSLAVPVTERLKTRCTLCDLTPSFLHPSLPIFALKDRGRIINAYRLLTVVAALFAVSGCATDTPKIVDVTPAESIPSAASDHTVPVQPIVPEPLASEGIDPPVVQSRICDILAYEFASVLRQGKARNYEYTMPLVHHIRAISKVAKENGCYYLASMADSTGDTAQSLYEYYADERNREIESSRKYGFGHGVSDAIVAGTCYKKAKSIRHPYLFAGALFGCSLYFVYTKLTNP